MFLQELLLSDCTRPEPSSETEEQPVYLQKDPGTATDRAEGDDSSTKSTNPDPTNPNSDTFRKTQNLCFR